MLRRQRHGGTPTKRFYGGGGVGAPDGSRAQRGNVKVAPCCAAFERKKFSQTRRNGYLERTYVKITYRL